jgi:hypothetical protein
MDDAARVRVMHGVRELTEHIERARNDKALVAFDEAIHRFAVGVLHRQVEPVVGQLAEVVDRDDVRMPKSVDRTRLTPESRDELRIAREARHQDLDRFLPTELEMLGEKYLAHPAAPERREDAPPIVKDRTDQTEIISRMA